MIIKTARSAARGLPKACTCMGEMKNTSATEMSHSASHTTIPTICVCVGALCGRSVYAQCITIQRNEGVCSKLTGRAVQVSMLPPCLFLPAPSCHRACPAGTRLLRVRQAGIWRLAASRQACMPSRPCWHAAASHGMQTDCGSVQSATALEQRVLVLFH